jgi:hypothetical protein
MFFSFLNLCSTFLRSFINAAIKEGEQIASLQSNKIQAGYYSSNNNNDHKKWSDTEHQMLLKAYRHHGEKWEIIAKCIRGRSANECKEEIKDFWVVEKFVDHRPSSEKKGSWDLRTRWVGWSSEDDTWEPISEKYEEVPDVVQKYIKRNPEVFIKQCSKRKRNVPVNMNSVKRVHYSSNVKGGGGQPSTTCCQPGRYTPWTDAELNTLVAMKDEWESWKHTVEAVNKVGHGRSQRACSIVFHSLNKYDKMRIRSGKSATRSLKNNLLMPIWTDAELQTLISSRENLRDWEKVSMAVSRVRCQRSMRSCYQKYRTHVVRGREKILKERNRKLFSTV